MAANNQFAHKIKTLGLAFIKVWYGRNMITSSAADNAILFQIEQKIGTNRDAYGYPQLTVIQTQPHNAHRNCLDIVYMDACVHTCMKYVKFWGFFFHSIVS